jgi:protein-S-isoprenylcysteine O-methyltransferase Ste14
MDRGTYPFIAIGIVVGLVADLLGFLSGIGSYLPEYAVAIGAVIAVVGLGIRGWALRTLGKFFTMPITIAADHRLVQNGPYRWIRHPAYTGGFLTMVGLAVALGSWLGVVVTLLAGVSVYVYRIRIEEAALRTRFGTEYDEYARRTYRLLPGLY